MSDEEANEKLNTKYEFLNPKQIRNHNFPNPSFWNLESAVIYLSKLPRIAKSFGFSKVSACLVFRI